MEKLARQLTLKYALLQSTYWISECVIYSFAAVFLHYKNFDNTQIGLVLSLSSIFSILLQPMVASYADRSKKVTLRTIVIILMLIALVSSPFLFIVKDSLPVIAAIFILINTIQFTLNPLFNSLAFEYMDQGVPMNYGLARGSASVAFAFTSTILGVSVNRYGAGILIGVFIISYFFLIASAYFFRVKNSAEIIDQLKNTSKKKHPSPSDHKGQTADAPTSILGFFFKYKKFSLLLIGISMIYYSHSILNTYLINIIQNIGGNSADMGIALTISAALELPTLAGFIYIIRKFPCNKLVKVSAFFFFVKILIAWLSPNVPILYLSQACQILAFALFTPASVYYVNSVIDEQDKVKGQSMLGVATWGLAGTVANLTGGKILDIGGVSDMLLIGTVVSFVGFIVICFTAEHAKLKV